ncbi:DNA-binding response regulator, partial [Francisella tularensis subsp. holarctica]|nr:DNA-binding response regulator [Francisella tularensis subsp. holarctica]
MRIFLAEYDLHVGEGLLEALQKE